MKENTLDVLFYLFDNFSDYDDSSQNREVLHGYLENAGFHTGEISKAFDWLESLADEDGTIAHPGTHSSRVFSAREKRWLDTQCQGYLMFLCDTDVLSVEMRERVIDRILALKDPDFDLSKLKWVVLMILLNQPGAEAEYTWMDDVAMGDEAIVYH
jgi:Smg protein